ncbi:unnamed protein product [Paramecium sonneborni]|uniref:Autophagy-related protein n=1 Tax=Paramecium sonneborni TaxID=65129 RepID=A0A8S1PX62_9CILI|nr:unnamed protein product [Paramecium sonneborni]
MSYKVNNSLEERQKKFQEYSQKNPDKIAIIIEQGPNSQLKQLDRPEVLINQDKQGIDLITFLKQKLCLPEQSHLNSIYIIEPTSKCVLNGNDNLREFYDKHKNEEDGFLYLQYQRQEFFG